MAIIREFALVRWLEEDQIGVMPMSAIVKDKGKALYVGAVVGIKWKPGEVYDAEILRISKSRKELNALCNSIINFKVTIEEVKGDEDCAIVTSTGIGSTVDASGPQSTKAAKATKNTTKQPKTATKQTKSAAKQSQKKEKEAAKIAAAKERANSIFADFQSENDSDTTNEDDNLLLEEDCGPKPKKFKKHLKQAEAKKTISSTLVQDELSNDTAHEDVSDDSNSSLLLEKQRKMIETLKRKLKSLSKPLAASVNSSATDFSEDIYTTVMTDDLDNKKRTRDDREESFLNDSFNKPSFEVSYMPYKTSSPIIQKSDHKDVSGRCASKDAGAHHSGKVEMKYVELVPGYGVTCTQRQIDEVQASSNRSPTKMIRLLMSVFFSEEELATCSCYGSGRNTTKRLDGDIVAACISKNKINITDRLWSFLTFAASNTGSSGQVTSEVTDKAGDPLNVPPLDTIKVLGIEGSPTKAFYNGEAIEGFSFDSTKKVMLLTSINVDLNSSFKITWE